METEMEITRDDLSKQEEVLGKLLNQWRNLDEKKVKKCLKNTKRIRRTAEQTNKDKSRVGKKRGRENIKDFIQLMGKMLVNTRRVVPLSVVFQNLNQTPQ